MGKKKGKGKGKSGETVQQSQDAQKQTSAGPSTQRSEQISSQQQASQRPTQQFSDQSSTRQTQVPEREQISQSGEQQPQSRYQPRQPQSQYPQQDVSISSQQPPPSGQGGAQARQLGVPERPGGVWGQPRQSQVTPQQPSQHVQAPSPQSQQRTDPPKPRGRGRGEHRTRQEYSEQRRPGGYQLPSQQFPSGYVQQGGISQIPPGFSQQPSPPIPIQQQQPFAPGRQQDAPGSVVTPARQRQQQQGRPTGQYMPIQQQQPHTQQQFTLGEQGDAPVTGVTSAPQKSHQKEKQAGSKQESGQRASTSSEMSHMKKTKSEDGVIQILPMELIKAQPGTKGRKIVLETNHLPLRLGSIKTAMHYDVNITPDTSKKYLHSIMTAFIQKHFSKKNIYPAFDGRKNLYSTCHLPEINGDNKVTIKNDFDKDKEYTVELKLVNEVDLTPLHNLRATRETPREALQVVDIVLRSALANSCTVAGRNFFMKKDRSHRCIDLGEGMEMYRGFYQSAIRGWALFLNVDVAHKAFPREMNVCELLPEVLGERVDLHRIILTREQEEKLKSFLLNLKISYQLPGGSEKPRIYRVTGLGEIAAKHTFDITTTPLKTTTVQTYYLENKRYRLNYPNLVTIKVGTQGTCLPPELCTVLPDQVTRRRMTERQTSNMIKEAATDTVKRKENIERALQIAAHNTSKSVEQFNFSVSDKFQQMDARILQPPRLKYANDKTVTPSRGKWNGDKILTGVTIKNWKILCVDRRPPKLEDINNFVTTIRQCATSMGITFPPPVGKPFDTAPCFSVMQIKSYFERLEIKYDVIFVIVPNNGPQYSYVKTAAEINVGCLTQCIKTKTLFRMNAQTAFNILLKVNSKLNGTNHCLSIRPPILNRPCIIMGADVTHPSPDSKNIPSVAAVTASHDYNAFQYNICWRLQPPRCEIIQDLEQIVIEQLRYFKEKTSRIPERIIFFRDGVSEGQFEEVRTSEIRAIRSACKKIEEGYEPLITFLVVQKRHHTRFFPKNPEKDSEDRNRNVPAGTCVDQIITHPFMQDFYLVSHASIQGVARPTKYCTLWDDNKFSNDDIEELTYFLCHMFTRCNRSVSYPAPTYYAHLAAARAKVYIEHVNLDMEKLHKEYLKFQIKDEIRKQRPMFFV